jgi:thiamine-phosphate pyrophosphorylase
MVAAQLGTQRREQLRAARLYLVCDSNPGGRPLAEVLPAAVAGGVDVVQLREKELTPESLLEPALAAAELCRELGVVFVLNDHPLVAREVEADGVHVGQQDMPVADARELVGEEMLLGLSTHGPHEIDAAASAPLDYIGVGPLHATPTKPGRPAVGLELVHYANAHATVPFFAIGGIHRDNIAGVREAGATRICVLRAIADAVDPQAAARALRARL